MDAGLGVKGYAVIEQGKIGQILSARPTERRQLIEEAAGVTKYKSRRRAAELKLEAAQQNLTRIDDIVFEVEKQRGTLKRQAAKARRYRRLREELRRWEKVQFALRYRSLGASIDAARTKLADARDREALAAARLAEIETAAEALRLELTQADAAETEARELAHARELAIGRLQQQVTFDRHQVETLGASAAAIEAEVVSLEGRREPARIELEERRAAEAKSTAERDQAAADLGAEENTYADLQVRIEGLEGDVEAARSEVFAAVNASTALRHAVEHAAAARTRIGEQIAKLDVEAQDLRIESERAAQDRAAAEAGVERAREAMDRLRVERAARESELAGARSTREGRARDFRAAEQESPPLPRGCARSRSSTPRAPSTATAPGWSSPNPTAMSARSGRWPTISRSTAATSARSKPVSAIFSSTLSSARTRRLRQVCASPRSATPGASASSWRTRVQRRSCPSLARLYGAVPMASIVRVSGPAARAIATSLAGAWIAESQDAARAAAAVVDGAVVTLEGVVYRGAYQVEGGARAEARGILATKREIKELRERLEAGREAVERLREEIATLDLQVAGTDSAIATVQSELHRQEKDTVGFELQVRSGADTLERLARKREQISIERRTAEEELRAQEARQEEARASITRIEEEQRGADDRLNAAQRRLFEARDAMQAQARRTAEAKAGHAALTERVTALAADIRRLEEAGRELETRVTTRREELLRTQERREQLREAIVTAEATLDADLRAFDDLRQNVRDAEERCVALRGTFEEHEARIKEARRGLEAVRAEAAQLDVARATAESDLTHLSAACVEAVQASLDEVSAEVEQLERDGMLASPRPVDDAPEPSELEGESEGVTAAPVEPIKPEAAPALTADEMVLDLRAKIDRMGPVNMMAIDQFDDLETRHEFLTTQRKDLIDSIAATSEAIKKIDKTTRERFTEAFMAINLNFEKTFTTLFGGGRAGLDHARRERCARERHRHHRAAAGQAPAERPAALGR